MTSAIVTTNINALYPVAGQDNNSQGFRDNFSAIKTGLTTAASEITDLQTNSARTDGDNDFNGVMIENAVTNDVHGAVLNSGDIDAATSIDVRTAEYFTYTFTDDIVLTFSNWPSSVDGMYTKVKIVVRGDAGTPTSTTNFVIGTTYTITNVGNTDFTAIGAASNTVGISFVATGVGGGTTGTANKNRTANFATTSGTVITNSNITLPIAISTNTSHYQVFEAWSSNGGNIVFVNYIGAFN